MDNLLYDQLYINKDRTDILSYLKPYFGKKLECYEIGAGTGLLSEILYIHFDKFLAIEPDSSYFQSLSKRAKKKFDAINGYIDDENIGNAKYNLGLCIFNVINHIEKENLHHFLEVCASKLANTGAFIFDCYNYSAVRKSPPTNYKKTTDQGDIDIHPELNNDVLSLIYSKGGEHISTMRLNLHSQTQLEVAIMRYFSSFERSELNGALGDPYFFRYKCML